MIYLRIMSFIIIPVIKREDLTGRRIRTNACLVHGHVTAGSGIEHSQLGPRYFGTNVRDWVTWLALSISQEYILNLS